MKAFVSVLSMVTFLITITAPPAFAQTKHEAKRPSGETSWLPLLELIPEKVELVQVSDEAERQRKVGLYKIIAGIGLMSTGVLLAATSGESATVTVTDPYFGSATVVEASSRSNGQLIGGLAMAGGGGFLAWLGAKDRASHSFVDSPVLQKNTGSGLTIQLGRITSVAYKWSW